MEEQQPGVHAPKQGSSDERYLEKLEFKPELRKSWLNFFVVNFRVVLLMIALLTAAGLYTYFKLPRESNPEVKIPIGVVSTIYPGASPSDVEEFVTKKIETKVAGLKGLKKISSTSANSISSIVVEFDAKEDLDDAIRRLKDKVDSTKPELPTDAKEPQVTEISLDDQPILTLVLTGPYDGFTLRQFADDLKSDLEKIQGVREVGISGGDEREFEVAYNPERLLFYGISADAANGAIAATNRAVPIGNFEGEKFIYPVRSDISIKQATDIENIPVAHTEDGSVVFVRDVAKVSEKAIKKTTLSRISIKASEPQNSVTLSVVKRTGSSVLDTVDTAKETAAEFVQGKNGLKYDVTLDFAEQVRKDFDQLSHDFLLTIVLVFAVLLLIVGLKEALVAGLAIPLVFFATFTGLYLIGISLNFLSLFSLILSLGLLVDDAIVVVSATKQYLRSGKFTPEEAVLLVLNDFKVVLTTTTLTTVWAFLPLLFATGIIGEYLKSIPLTVSITLLSSLFIALMINHPLAAVLERVRLTRWLFILLELLLIVAAAIAGYQGGFWGYFIAFIAIGMFAGQLWWYERGGREKLVQNKQLQDAEWESDELVKQKLRSAAGHPDATFFQKLLHGIINFHAVLPWYEKILRKLTATKKTRWFTVGGVALLFVFAVLLPVTGIVQTEFFPVSDNDYAYVDIRLPVGSTLAQTDKIAQGIEAKLRGYKEIANFSTVIGRGSALSDSAGSGSNIGSVTMTLKPKEERSLKSYEFEEKLRRDLGVVPGATITVAGISNGPPTGAAIEAQIAGDDLKTLDKIAQDLKPRLASVPGTVNINISLKDSAPEYTFVLDPQRLEQNFLNAAYVGSVLRMAIAGSEVSTVIRDNKEIKIQARFDQASIPTLESLQNLQIVNLRKQPVFLKDVASIELKPAVDSIARVDQKRTVRLTSGVDSSTNSTLALKGFQEKIKDYQLPQGYVITFGGENEQNQESVLSIIQAMVIAMLLIVATLIIQFNSFRKALIVLVTIPLALVGVFIGMAVTGVTLSFPGLIGILALFGIVVKNAIILVDKMNLNLGAGIPFIESVIDAGKSRMEAIFITSICTIFGILPVTLSNEFWRGLGSAVIFGLILSSFLTLFIVPTLFMLLVKPPKEKVEIA